MGGDIVIQENETYIELKKHLKENDLIWWSENQYYNDDGNEIVDVVLKQNELCPFFFEYRVCL